MGLFQEALQAMFALIKGMEKAIKIKTSIIFGNRGFLMRVKLNVWCKNEEKNWTALEKYSTKDVKSVTFGRGVSQMTFCLCSLLFKSDRRQVSSSIHTL